MANQKKKKTNISNIIRQMELDLMRAGKIPGEEGSSIVGEMQLRKKLAEMPQGGGITPLLPTSPLDLAFETLLTAMAHSEGIDPRVAIATGLAAGKVAPKLPAAARAINIKGGGALSRHQYKKGMKSASKDPMFSDIDYPRQVKFIRAKDPEASGARGWYSPRAGIARREKELYPNRPTQLSKSPSIFLREQTLGELFKVGFPRNIQVPAALKPKWAESIVRHESRHYKQHVEGMKRAERQYGERDLTTFGYGQVAKLKPIRRLEKKYGYPADKQEAAYSTLIRIPRPKNMWPDIPKKYIDKKGFPMSPETVIKRVKDLTGDEKYALEYGMWYQSKLHQPHRRYFREKIEVEARLEEITLGKGRESTRAFNDLVNEAGYTKKQVLDMVTEYRIAKKKYRPGKYRADTQEFKKPTDFTKIKAKKFEYK